MQSKVSLRECEDFCVAVLCWQGNDEKLMNKAAVRSCFCGKAGFQNDEILMNKAATDLG